MTLTAVDLLDLTQSEIDDLFRRSPAGPIPSGEGDGTVIVAPDTTLGEVAAKLVHLLAWKGKIFDPEHGGSRTWRPLTHLASILSDGANTNRNCFLLRLP